MAKINIKDFCWGEIQNIHQISDSIDVIEYIEDEDAGTRFHPYVDGKDLHKSFTSLDRALLCAIAAKHDPDGLSTRADEYMARMIGLEW